MNILIITFGSRGDVQPFVALGQGLKAIGHTVTICTSSSFQSFITDHGLNYGYASNALMDLMDSVEGREAMETSRDVLGVVRTTIKLMNEAKSINQQLLIDSWATAQAADPDIVIFHPKALGGVSIAEKLNIPAVMVLPCPMIVPTAEWPTIGFPHLNLGGWYNTFTYKLVQMGYQMYGAQVDKFRQAQLGLSKFPKSSGLLRLANGQPIPVLHCYSAHVTPRPRDWPAHIHVTGYWFLDQAEKWEPSVELKAFLDAGEAPVYIGFGSMAGRQPGRLANIVVEALKKANLRGIIATGGGGLDVDQLPDTLLKIKAEPHEHLFPHVSAVIHHGGAGTTAAGLRAGKPTIVCPFIGDQSFWGERVYELGVGPKPISQKKLSADSLADALLTATSNVTMREKAQALGAQIRHEKGIETAIAAIEAVLNQSDRQTYQSTTSASGYTESS